MSTSLASATYVRSTCKGATATSAVELHARTIPCASSSLLQHQWQSCAGLVLNCKDVSLPQHCSVVLARTD
eukprot:2523866-Amphidinium_carterae.1